MKSFKVFLEDAAPATGVSGIAGAQPGETPPVKKKPLIIKRKPNV